MTIFGGSTVYIPRLGTDNIQTRNFESNRKLLTFHLSIVSFSKITFEMDFFHDHIHVYSPRVRMDNTPGTKV